MLDDIDVPLSMIWTVRHLRDKRWVGWTATSPGKRLAWAPETADPVMDIKFDGRVTLAEAAAVAPETADPVMDIKFDGRVTLAEAAAEAASEAAPTGSFSLTSGSVEVVLLGTWTGALTETVGSSNVCSKIRMSSGFSSSYLNVFFIKN